MSPTPASLEPFAICRIAQWRLHDGSAISKRDTMQNVAFGIIVAVAATIAAEQVSAQQWDDAIQWDQQNVTAPYFPSAVPLSDASILVAGASCPVGEPLPTFTAPNIGPHPSGYSNTSCVGGGGLNINLNEFARQSDLMTTDTQLSNLTADLNQLSDSVATELSQLNKNLRAASQHADEGTAMAFAMSGTPELQENEHIAFSGNVGAFQSQTGGAVGVAYRLADHVSVNAGFARSFRGSASGGRVGIRFGW